MLLLMKIFHGVVTPKPIQHQKYASQFFIMMIFKNIVLVSERVREMRTISVLSEKSLLCVDEEVEKLRLRGLCT